MKTITAQFPFHGRDASRSRAPRNRRVRLSYPAALVELALVLCGTVGTRQAALVLGVGTSTIYRWIELHRTAWMPPHVLRKNGTPAHVADVVAALSTRCERAGFRVRSSLFDADSLFWNGANEAPDSQSANQLRDNAEIDGRISTLGETGSNVLAASVEMKCAKQAIEENFLSPLSCQKLADMVGMPRLKFIKHFASTFGVPPYHYLLGFRVQRAWEMLRKSNATLPIVAAASGFGSAGSMQRAFKRFAGASPAKLANLISSNGDFMSEHSYATQKVPQRGQGHDSANRREIEKNIVRFS